jgi:hypothetical protein
MYTEFFHVDSRARFLETPVRSPNNYRFDLPRLLRGVREIEVFRAEVPSSMYNITATDPPFMFTMTAPSMPSQTFSWQIAPGAYTLATVVAKLNELKNSDLGCGCMSPYLTFSGNETTGKLSLTVVLPDSNTKLTFHPYYAFGIDHTVHGAGDASQWVVTTPHPVRFNTPTVLFLSFPNIRAIGTSSDIDVHSGLFGHQDGHTEGHVARGCITARMQLTAGQWNVNYIESEPRVYLRSFPSGAVNVHHLDILFTDPLGRLIDFNGADHSLFLRVAYESR